MAHYAIEQDVCDTASSSRKYTNRNNRIESHDRLVRDYFAEEPKFDEDFFRTRFRMSRQLFVKIATYLESNFQYFQRRVDGRGKMGFPALQRCTSAVRQLGYGSLDCTHWAWDNCPVAWRGQYTRGDHHGPTISLGAVASQDTWIWHAYFGVAGSNNDINVLNQSLLFNSFKDGTTLMVPFTVNGTEYKYPYFLVDGIYPRYVMFVKTIPHPTGEKMIRLAKAQEAARKDMERAFDEDHALCPDYIPDPPVAPQPSGGRLADIHDSNVHENLRMDLIDHIHRTFIPGLDR
uniref:uncharacterized protein LOC122600513 n=1 Tax=Erigeron canadensis TaxID=72917 RepID=UPI001CB8FC22|nr:uncharacterized protein LOC122600513 [Erigeron canadensis]